MIHRHSAKQASVIAAKCMDFLGKYELPPTPVNYAVAYEIACGKNDSLLQTVRELADNKLLDSFRFQELYFTYIDERHELHEEMLAPISELIHDMINTFQKSADSVDKYQRQLEEGGDALDHAPNPKEIILALTKATKLAQQDQAQLYERLSAAESEVKVLKSNLEKLEIEAITDPLSELHNRKGLERELELKPVEAANNCVGIFDIDHFKKINDNYGHNFGDYVIRQVAREIKNHIRGADLAVRWGGEEFLLVLRGTDLKGAAYVSNKIREAIKALRWKNTRTGEQLPPVTISGGLTQMRQSEDLLTDLDSIVERADECLYKAKQGGRNRITA